jgi:DNA-binding transcriptional ArsR family regulator
MITTQGGGEMREKKTSVILHPVRIRIIEVLQGRQLTPYQMHEHLPDIPLPTLYRHLKIMLEAEVVRIAASNQRHGAVESVYEAVPGGARISLDEFRELSVGDHSRYFQTFTAENLAAFQRYIVLPEASPVEDGLRYFCALVSLNEEEMNQMWSELHAVITKYDCAQGSGRTRRRLAIQAVPEAPFRNQTHEDA